MRLPDASKKSKRRASWVLKKPLPEHCDEKSQLKTPAYSAKALAARSVHRNEARSCPLLRG